jgi:hypothetical protein
MSVFDNEEPVVFEIDGVEVSNDPRWFSAQQRTQLEAQVAATAVNYGTLKPAELKKLAQERQLDLTGITKKSELVALLQKLDAETTGSEVPAGPSTENDEELDSEPAEEE